MADQYLSLDELNEIVLATAGVHVDVEQLEAAPAEISELGIDSLAWMGVVAALENQFSIKLDTDLEEVTTLPALAVLVNNALTEPVPGRTDNRILIHAPLDHVWSTTNDVETWPELFSEYAESEILHRDGDTIQFRLSTRPDQSGTVYSWVSERTPDERLHVVNAHRVETGVFEHMNITWTYREVDGGVEMRWIQEFAMKPAAPFNVREMTLYLNTNSLVQMSRIRRLVEAPVSKAAA